MLKQLLELIFPYFKNKRYQDRAIMYLSAMVSTESELYCLVTKGSKTVSVVGYCCRDGKLRIFGHYHDERRLREFTLKDAFSIKDTLDAWRSNMWESQFGMRNRHRMQRTRTNLSILRGNRLRRVERIRVQNVVIPANVSVLDVLKRDVYLDFHGLSLFPVDRGGGHIDVYPMYAIQHFVFNPSAR